MTREMENARLALAAWPHCARIAMHTRVGDDRDAEMARLAEDALGAGWMVVSGNPVAPPGWEERYRMITRPGEEESAR